MAAVGSKFEGTGLTKLHIVHIQVAVLAIGDSGGGLKAPSLCAGDGEPFRFGVLALERARLRSVESLDAFGTMVILADDFKNPA